MITLEKNLVKWFENWLRFRWRYVSERYRVIYYCRINGPNGTSIGTYRIMQIFQSSLYTYIHRCYTYVCSRGIYRETWNEFQILSGIERVVGPFWNSATRNSRRVLSNFRSLLTYSYAKLHTFPRCMCVCVCVCVYGCTMYNLGG